jgi:hypothetical protein
MTLAEENTKLKKELKIANDKLESLGIKGKAKLYYSLNRNMAELSEMLDSIDLQTIDITDPKDKTMERLKIIWASVTPLVETVRILGESAGITGDEKKDTTKKGTFLDRNID